MKPTKWPVRPAKTQISLGIRPVWSEALLTAWRNLGSLATNRAHSEDADQTGRMPSLIWVFAGWAHMPFSWFYRAAAQFYGKYHSVEFINTLSDYAISSELDPVWYSLSLLSTNPFMAGNLDFRASAPSNLTLPGSMAKNESPHLNHF